MRILRDGLIARCPSFRVRCGVAGPAPPSLRPGRITSSCLKAFYLALLGGRTERERERERREGRRIARLMASFFTRTHISASPLLPPACREGTSRHSRRRSAVTLHFGLPARNCRRVYNSCLSLLDAYVSCVVCMCVVVGAPITLFYPHNTTMHLWRLGLLEIGHHSLCLTLCVYSPLSISHRSTEAEKYRGKEREKERIFNRSVASSKMVSPLECGCAVHVLLKS